MTRSRRNRRRGDPPTHDPASVRKAREDAGLMQQELAERVGISISYMSEIESGTRSPRPELLQLMANALDVDVKSVEFKGCTCRCHLAVAG